MENEERVFLTYRAVFEGQNAQIRQQKAILKIINKHGKSAQTLLKSLGEKYVIGTLKSLLERKVFQSELEAKLAFPDLFKTSLAQDVQHNASEADAARSEVEALEDVASLMGDADDVSEIANEIPSVPHPASRSIPLLPRYPLRSSTAVSVQPLTNGIEIPSLYPVYIPFKTQHLVLNKTQQLLEECCYDFSTQWMPELLKQRRWDCPEAIELNKWTHSVVNRLDKLPQSCSSAFADDSRSSVASCLISINKLRHSAVHRLPTTAKGISEMIHSAIRFARVLRDSAREQQLTKLDYELQGKFRALALNKNYLETKLERELQEIARQRRELDNKEKEAVVMISREDEDHQSLIASLLSNSVQQIFDGHEDKAPEATEAERSSDHEMEVEEGQGYASISDEDGQVELDPPTKEKPITDRGTGSEEREPNLVHQSFIQAGPSASPPAASSLCHEICNQEDHKLKNSPKLHLENETPCTLDSQADLILAIEPMGNTPTTTHGIAMAEAEVGDSKSSPSDYSIPQKVYDLLAHILSREIWIAFYEAVDDKLSSYSFDDGDFKKLSDKRLHRISNYVKKQTKLDTALYQIELHDLINLRFATFSAEKRPSTKNTSKKKYKPKPSQKYPDSIFSEPYLPNQVDQPLESAPPSPHSLPVNSLPLLNNIPQCLALPPGDLP